MPPLEGQLADYCVWPEVRKLYGHSNDIVCMALNLAPSGGGDSNGGDGGGGMGRYLATACKARNAQTAAILVWDTVSMRQVGALQAHESTVSCLGFSHDGRVLASSGKDRALCLYERTSSSGSSSASATNPPYELYALQKGAHKRIVWDLTWAQHPHPHKEDGGDDTLVLLTASRDGSCKVWAVRSGLSDSERVSALVCKFSFSPFAGVAVTAVQLRVHTSAAGVGQMQAAVGSEQGELQLWASSTAGAGSAGSADSGGSIYEFDAVGCVHSGNCHGAAVRAIRWSAGGLLASAGDDGCVRVLQLPKV